jgi:hypothetical protein
MPSGAGAPLTTRYSTPPSSSTGLDLFLDVSEVPG